ncbi:hypothetical protein GGR32_000162 [Mesonia hippocampi]|uniref:Uncharacterized protein n=1 Tax=Mesonia hippocampi TaxID=1628250 RepID=A0A840ELM9_9FLAO|nr:hypothetical protein [Mesonia hippocampi]MBB4117890.1 hypothetical protein [Mesonia hippocampi]
MKAKIVNNTLEIHPETISEEHELFKFYEDYKDTKIQERVSFNLLEE